MQKNNIVAEFLEELNPKNIIKDEINKEHEDDRVVIDDKRSVNGRKRKRGSAIDSFLGTIIKSKNNMYRALGFKLKDKKKSLKNNKKSFNNYFKSQENKLGNSTKSTPIKAVNKQRSNATGTFIPKGSKLLNNIRISAINSQFVKFSNQRFSSNKLILKKISSVGDDKYQNIKTKKLKKLRIRRLMLRTSKKKLKLRIAKEARRQLLIMIRTIKIALVIVKVVLLNVFAILLPIIIIAILIAIISSLILMIFS